MPCSSLLSIVSGLPDSDIPRLPWTLLLWTCRRIATACANNTGVSLTARPQQRHNTRPCLGKISHASSRLHPGTACSAYRYVDRDFCRILQGPTSGCRSKVLAAHPAEVTRLHRRSHAILGSLYCNQNRSDEKDDDRSTNCIL